MEKGRHIIKKQTVEVTCASDQNPFDFKERLSEFCVDGLLLAMEKLFEEKASEKFFRADRLFIDAGELPEEGWEGLLIERVLTQLSQCIDDAAFVSRMAEPASARVVTTSTMDTGARNNLREVEGQENLFNAVLYFLACGRLPWYAGVGNQTSLHDGLLLIISQPSWLSRLVDLIKNDSRAFDRLLYQANENVILSVVVCSGLETGLVISLQKFLTEIINKLKAASGLALTGDGTKYVVYGILLRAALDGVKTDSQKIAWDDYFLYAMHLTVKKFSGNGIGRLLSVLSESAFENFKEKAQTSIQKYLHEKETADDTTTIFSTSRKAHSAADLAEDGLFIANAGLVLLHPFLSLLFENTGYIYNKVWTSEEHKQRALALTQFMITGNDEFPEFELTLNKILIGYPMEDTLPADIQLSKFEKQEGLDVLKSMIRHWTALKNTSVEGLQSSFLQREGKLLLTESGWRLQPEHKTMDILVNRLPWSFSIVKTPWMDMKLYVDWNN